MQSSPPNKQSRQVRHRVLKGASILRTINDSEVRCTIRNMHSDGAELNVPSDASIGDKFLLYVHRNAIAYCAEVQWRTGNRMGVRFTGTEPKPRWHYG